MLVQSEWVRKIGKFVADNREVALALLVPPVHFLWNRYNVRNYKRSLRDEIAKLLEHRESLSKLSGLAKAGQILADIENDLSHAITELVAAGARHDYYRRLSFRPPLARWFLLYKPPTLGAWIVHLFFFLYLAIVFLGTLAASIPWNEDSSTALLGFAFLLIPAYFLQWLARRIARKQTVAPVAPSEPIPAPISNS
jgi:hypothetical protein